MAGFSGKTVALGSPPSSIHQISQVELADWMTEYEAIASSGGISYVRGTVAGLSGIGADGDYALVITSEPERGVYERVSGSWVLRAALPALYIESLAASQAESDRILAQAAAASANDDAGAASISASEAAASQSLADVARTQAQLAAVAAGATIYASVAAGEAGTVNGDVFLVSTDPGVQVYENTAGTGTLIGYLGEVILDDLAALKAWNPPVYPQTGLIVRTRKENFAATALTAGATTQNLTTSGGVNFFVEGGGMLFPSTGPSGDDAPNVILGAYGAVDLPGSTYGNIVGGPRDPNISGGVGYRNRLGSSTVLSVILGGDNDIDALAAFNIGHHNSADVTDGASHPIMIGTHLNAGEAYGIAMGTENDNWARNAAIIGGRDHRIGTQGGGADARNSFIGGGATNTIDGQYAGIIGGQLCKATQDYSYAGGYGAVANTAGERVFSSVLSGTNGFRQVSEYHMSRDISGAIATQLLSAGAVRAAIGAKSTVSLQAQINAARTDVEGETGAWVLNAQLSNMGGTWAVKSQSATTVHADVTTGGGRVAWVVDVIATGGTWQIRFQGENAMTFIVDAYVREIMTRTS